MSEENARKYLSKKMNPFAAEDLLFRMKKYDDIFQEFLTFVETEKYPDVCAESEGWTAKKLSEKLTHLEPQIVYEFLVGLREKPDTYKKYIEEGAPIYD